MGRLSGPRPSTAVLSAAVTRSTVNVVADHVDGSPVFEELLVDDLEQSRFRLLASPGLTLGLAAGDEILVDPSDGTFTLVERGGNLAVWLYTNEGMDDAVESVAAAISQLGGRLDGLNRKLVVFTVPAATGFPAVEEIFYRFVDENPGSEWFFGNVYDPTDGVTPLNWW